MWLQDARASTIVCSPFSPPFLFEGVKYFHITFVGSEIGMSDTSFHLKITGLSNNLIEVSGMRWIQDWILDEVWCMFLLISSGNDFVLTSLGKYGKGQGRGKKTSFYRREGVAAWWLSDYSCLCWLLIAHWETGGLYLVQWITASLRKMYHTSNSLLMSVVQNYWKTQWVIVGLELPVSLSRFCNRF